MSDAYTVGVQSVVFQHLSLTELLSALDETTIDTLELWDGHLAVDDDESTITAAERAVEDAGVSICGFGVVDLESVADARRQVAFADRLGAAYLSVNYPPARDDITEALVDAADEFGVDVGIHNYSSVHHDDLSTVFSTIADVREVLARYDHPRLGICVDTGHFLVEDVRPEDVIRELGDRINGVHLKDTSTDEIEDLPGAGRLDLPFLLDLLDEHADVTAPPVIEYELPEHRATEALREAETNVRKALE
jgi:sugar phosphate isomerase/epimerase